MNRIVTELRGKRQSAAEICHQVVERIHARDATLQSFESLNSSFTTEATHVGVLASCNRTLAASLDVLQRAAISTASNN